MIFNDFHPTRQDSSLLGRGSAVTVGLCRRPTRLERQRAILPTTAPRSNTARPDSTTEIFLSIFGF